MGSKTAALNGGGAMSTRSIIVGVAVVLVLWAGLAILSIRYIHSLANGTSNKSQSQLDNTTDKTAAQPLPAAHITALSGSGANIQTSPVHTVPTPSVAVIAPSAKINDKGSTQTSQTLQSTQSAPTVGSGVLDQNAVQPNLGQLEGACASQAPAPGSLCFIEGQHCGYNRFCCPSCKSNAPGDVDCTHYATKAMCTSGHWVLVSLGSVCHPCALASGSAKGTCEGFCGTVGSTGDCLCTLSCEFWESCCDDYAQHCAAPTASAPTLPARTCKDRCGMISLSYDCFCDPACQTVGNCCPDYQAECGSSKPKSTTTVQPALGNAETGALKRNEQQAGVPTAKKNRPKRPEKAEWLDNNGWPVEPLDEDDNDGAAMGQTPPQRFDNSRSAADIMNGATTNYATHTQRVRSQNSNANSSGGNSGSFREWWVADGQNSEEEPLPQLPEIDPNYVSGALTQHDAPVTASALSSLEYPPDQFYLILLVKDRYDTLQQTLASLTSVIGFQRDRLIISQERDSSSFVDDVIRSFDIPRRNWLHHETPVGLVEGAEFIAAHYKWALKQAFDLFPSAPFLVVIEDDMTFSKDFLLYFSHVAPLLVSESKHVWTASAWNDNGFKSRVHDPTRILRTQWFIGFGWLLSRKLFLEELYDNWPQTHWDHWMRDPRTNKGRETLFPEMCRNFHIGVYGTHSDSELYDRFFANILMYDGNAVGFESRAELTHLRFEARLQSMISRCEFVSSVRAVESSSNQLVCLIFEAKKLKGGTANLELYDELAETFGIWHSSGGMTPRGSHNGVVQFRAGGSKLVFLIPSSSPYVRLVPTFPKFDFLKHAAQTQQNALPDVPEGGYVPPNAPPFKLTGGIAPLGQSCSQACQKLSKGKSKFECDQRGFLWLNNCYQLQRAFQCTSCLASEGADQPALDVFSGKNTLTDAASKKGTCLYTAKQDSTCSGKHSKTRRLCPCREL